jgi:CDP-glucose 4,6-dehydratase
MNLYSDIFRGKRILITGHTGFKGSWLSLMLKQLGAEVYGYALDPPSIPSLFLEARVNEIVHDYRGDIRNIDQLSHYVAEIKPEIVFHLAAQSLVRKSYQNPIETYEINIMGTINLLETVRNNSFVKALVNVTTDKCYENREWIWGYRENEQLGGYDPYSSSKACSEIATSSYRRSFFNNNSQCAIATVRAGNAIGGGDWAEDRLIPDIIRAIISDKKIIIRNPGAIRPWQHVLEPLSGYLKLTEKLFTFGNQYADAWNFGPYVEDAKPVEWIVKELCSKWSNHTSYEIDIQQHLHEAGYLTLDCSKARSLLGWYPRWKLIKTLDSIIEFSKAYKNNEDLRELCYKQIDEYFNTVTSSD